MDIIEAPIDSLASESPPVITLPENILDGLQIGTYVYLLPISRKVHPKILIFAIFLCRIRHTSGRIQSFSGSRGW